MNKPLSFTFFFFLGIGIVTMYRIPVHGSSIVIVDKLEK